MRSGTERWADGRLALAWTLPSHRTVLHTASTAKAAAAAAGYSESEYVALIIFAQITRLIRTVQFLVACSHLRRGALFACMQAKHAHTAAGGLYAILLVVHAGFAEQPNGEASQSAQCTLILCAHLRVQSSACIMYDMYKCTMLRVFECVCECESVQ